MIDIEYVNNAQKILTINILTNSQNPFYQYANYTKILDIKYIQTL